MKKKPADFKSKAEVSLVFFENYIQKLMGRALPDNTLNAIMEMVFTGKMQGGASEIINKNKEVTKAIKEITDEEWKALNTFIKGQSPFTDKGIKKAAGGKSGRATTSYFTQIARTFGSSINEISAARLTSSVVNASMANITGKLDTELTGNKNKETDISDFVMTLKFSTDGKPFKAGVDVKFTSDASKAGVVYSRRSSDKNRFVDELEPLFFDRQLQVLTYLLTNLYFHKGETDPIYDAYFDYIMDIVQLTAGLRTLLPTRKGERINFANPKSVANLLVSDQRMFILLNDQLYLMTAFLKAISDSVFVDTAPDRKKAKGIIMQSLKAILDNINSDQKIGELKTNGLPQGPFYKEKRNIIKTLGSDTTTAYADLKAQVSDVLIENKISRWKYRGFNIPLQIRS